MNKTEIPLLSTQQRPRALLWIRVLSVVIPVAVAILLNPRMPKLELGPWTKTLPHAIGAVNTLTALALLAGLYFIKNNNIAAHKQAMLAAFGLGGVFLVLYILYHVSNPSTAYASSDPTWRGIYYFVLISHIVMSFGVVPLVLLALYYAFSGQFARHRRLVRYGWPLWFYVSVSGVVAYLMIRPYYS